LPEPTAHGSHSATLSEPGDQNGAPAPADALIRLVSAICRVGSVEEACELAMRGIDDALAPDRCAVLIYDDAMVMRFCASRGLSDEYKKRVEGHSPWTPDATAPEPVTIPDVSAAAELGELREVVLREGIQAIAFIPLMARRLVGKFMLYFDRPHAFDAQELATAQTVAGVVAFAIERIRAESGLREREEFLAGIIESSPDCIKVLALDGRILSINGAGARALEIDDVHTLLGQSWIAYWQGDDRAAARHALEAAVQGETGGLEGYCPSRSGRPYWWDVRLTPLRSSTGRIERVVAISRDITERRRVQALTSGQHRALEMIVRGEPIRDVLDTLCRVVEEQGGGAVASILLLDDKGCLHDGSSPSLPESYVSAIDGLQIHPDVGTCAAAAARRQTVFTPDIAAAPSWKGLSHLPLELGLCSAWSMPIMSGTGEVLGTFGTYFREKRQPTPAEIETVQTLTRTAAVALEHDRAARALVAALAGEQDARRAAEIANRAKDEFLATLSHELRTPLMAMFGWTRALRDGRLDPERQTRALESVERNTRLLAQLIEDLLDVSRIVSGKLTLELTPTPLVPIVEAAIEAVHHAAVEKRITLDVALADGAVLVAADTTRLQQVVWNLLANAVKFTPEGGRVSVRLARTGPRVEIQVNDTGCGIPADFLPHIFDRFSQVDSTSRRRHGGLGLGLAIVRNLVKLHGGDVRAESAGEGQGATFTITFPIADPLLTHETNGHSPATSVPGMGSRLAGIHVLVVDDDKDARGLFAGALRFSGAAVTTADSTSAALDAMRRERPDVLLADISMPERDGYDLIAAVRLAHGRARLPAIAVSAHARKEDRERALAAGYDDYVTKPVDPAQLAAVIARLLGRDRRAPLIAPA
jgi:PAS domain S-box-containing protein